MHSVDNILTIRPLFRTQTLLEKMKKKYKLFQTDALGSALY